MAVLAGLQAKDQPTCMASGTLLTLGPTFALPVSIQQAALASYTAALLGWTMHVACCLYRN